MSIKNQNANKSIYNMYQLSLQFCVTIGTTIFSNHSSKYTIDQLSLQFCVTMVTTFYQRSKYTIWLALIAARKLKMAAATTTVTVLSTRSIMDPRNVERINCAKNTILLTTAISVPRPRTWIVVSLLSPSFPVDVDSLN